MIKKIRAKINSFKKRFKWHKEMVAVKKLIKSSKTVVDTNICFKNLLILAPHSDDEWIGCSSLLIDETSNCIVCSMDMDGGNNALEKEKRFCEMQQLSKIFKHHLIRLENDKTLELTRFIYEKQPDYIAVPFFTDWHPEHIETMRCLKNSLGDYQCGILMYQVSCPIPISAVNCALATSKKQFKKKWNLFKQVYQTQKNIPWMRFAFLERAEGNYVGAYAASVFCMVDSKSWKNMFNDLPTQSEIEEIKSKLNDIYSNFVFVNEIWLKKSH